MSRSGWTLDVLCVGLANQDVSMAVEGYPPADAKVEVPDLAEQGGGPAASAVVVTMGAAGHLVATREGTWWEPAFPVQAVDNTGAGDAFHGGFAFALARGGGVP